MLIPTLNSFVAGTTINPTPVNDNFDAVRTAFNDTAVQTDVAKTITVSHLWRADQTLDPGSSGLADGGALNSPKLALTGYYDSDATTAVVAAARTMHLQNVVTAGGGYALSVQDNAGGEVASINSAGNTSLSGTLSVTGAATVGGGIKASGNAYTKGVNIERTDTASHWGIAGFTGGGLQFFDYNAGSASRLVINASGNLGLGTTDIEAWHSDYRAMQTGARFAHMASTLGSGSALGENFYQTGAGIDASAYKVGTFATRMKFYSGAISFQTAPSGTADTAIPWITPLTIENGGHSVFTRDGSAAIPTDGGMGGDEAITIRNPNGSAVYTALRLLAGDAIGLVGVEDVGATQATIFGRVRTGSATSVEVFRFHRDYPILRLPTTDPGVPGALWNNGGVVNVS